ncbi:MAG: phosphoribosylglycinamide formyltransferase, partial [Candidatus Promineifilaceae bacterium]
PGQGEGPGVRAARPGKQMAARLPRLAVLVSGSGTNLQAILDACAAGRLAAEVALVVSNRRAAFGLVRAERAGVPSLYFPLRPYRDAGRDREAYDADLAAALAAYRPDLVVLAGWMHVLSPAFLDRFPGRVINLHPALPGQFAGAQAIERAHAAFQRGEIRASGCMVHYVVPEVDAGPVIAQVSVPIRPGEPLADFEARMHAAEHGLIVRATGLALAALGPVFGGVA